MFVFFCLRGIQLIKKTLKKLRKQGKGINKDLFLKLILLKIYCIEKFKIKMYALKNKQIIN